MKRDYLRLKERIRVNYYYKTRLLQEALDYYIAGLIDVTEYGIIVNVIEMTCFDFDLNKAVNEVIDNVTGCN